MKDGKQHLEAMYVSRLHDITTDGCPHTFRAAWLEYVQAWETRTNTTAAWQKCEKVAMEFGVAPLYAEH